LGMIVLLYPLTILPSTWPTRSIPDSLLARPFWN
jgi:hypothetical protein